MKTELLHFAKAGWRLLTDVPGWPDAPRWLRVRRSLPFLLPCVALVLLAGWNAAVRDPAIRAERAAEQPLLALEREIAALRVDCSEQQAGELAARSAALSKRLLAGPAQLGPVLQALTREASDRHWEAKFKLVDAPDEEAPPADARVIFLPVWGKLTSAASIPGSFPALLALLERVSASDKRIDLTRLSFRADEQGRYTVEVNLRLASLSSHEKVTQ